MAKFKIKELEQWETFTTRSGEEIRLKVRSLGRTAQIEASAIVRLDPTRLAEVDELLRRDGVVDWDGVLADDGEPIKFSLGMLDTLLGIEDEMAEKVTACLARLSGLTVEEQTSEGGERPLESSSAPSSISNSTADSSPPEAGSPSGG